MPKWLDDYKEFPVLRNYLPDYIIVNKLFWKTIINIKIFYLLNIEFSRVVALEKEPHYPHHPTEDVKRMISR